MKQNYTTINETYKSGKQQTQKSKESQNIIDWRVAQMSFTQPGRPPSGSCLAPGSFISTNKAAPRQSAVKCSSVWQKCPQFGHTYLCPTFDWFSQHWIPVDGECTERTVICFSSKSSLFNFPSRKLLTWLMICTWLPHSLIPLSCSAWLLNIYKTRITVKIWSFISKLIRIQSGPQLCALRMQIN